VLWRLVAGHGGGEVAFDVEVDVVADADLDLVDLAAGEIEPAGVFAADGVA
jgi:hypothetical protein